MVKSKSTSEAVSPGRFVQSLHKKKAGIWEAAFVRTAKAQYNLTNAREYFEERLCVGDYGNNRNERHDQEHQHHSASVPEQGETNRTAACRRHPTGQ